MTAWIACLALLAVDAPAHPDPGGDIRATYEARQQATGRSPDDQVRLAYWCEAHGLDAERLRHLALAVLADPDHAAARGLLGLVSRDRRWLKPEAVADRVRADPALTATLAEYDAKRAAAPYTADGQWGLAVWAEEHGLAEQARAHLTTVVRLDPGRDAAWKRLGYRKVDGRWTSDAEVAAARADAEAQKAADRKWKPLLERWKAQLARPNQRAEAEAGLLAVTDPRALAHVARTFLTGREADQLVAVRLLGQIDSAASSRWLSLLAVSPASAEVRRQAMETLRHRDPREFADLLIAQLRKKVRYQVRPVGGPGSPGALFVEGKQFNTQRVYAPPGVAYAAQPGDQLTIDAAGMPYITRQVGEKLVSTGRLTGATLLQGMNTGWTQGLLADPSDPLGRKAPDFGAFNPIFQPFAVGAQHARASAMTNQLRSAIRNVAATEHSDPTQFGFVVQQDTAIYEQIPLAQMQQEALKSAAVAQQQLQGDVQVLDRLNEQIGRENDRILQVLTNTTGVDFREDIPAWQGWWVNQVGYRSSTSPDAPVPTVVENVPLAYQPQPVAPIITTITGPVTLERMSCFGAGTPVRTVTGPRPIEALAVGDLVLTQSVATGALGYHPILATHHNPPSTTFRIRLGDEAIVSSQFHRFWVARRGWVMARDLKPGDPIRTLAGVRTIDGIEAGQVELVYNLDVADDADFFAGAAAALVHDNTLPDPRLVPFDRAEADVPKALAARP